MRRTVIFTALGLLVTGLALATAGQKAPETVVLDACGTRQAAVTFPHKAHFERTECATCHHTQKELTADSEIEVKACTSCHLEPEDAATPSCSEMGTTKNPFHIACISCHKDEVKKDAANKAPTKCAACHVKG